MTTRDDLTSEERWTRWVAAGAARDRRTDARARVLAVAVGAGLLVWFAVLFAIR